MNPVAIWMQPMPIITLSSAVSRGKPAATSEPKVMTSTTAATTRPMTSVALCSGCPSTAVPPNSTPIPASRATPAAANRLSRASSVISPGCTL